jgi:RNA polymerase sigma-70 factor (ECF subfamily)
MANKEEQFKTIVTENSERIKRICSYYAPDPDEQKDIYQEVLINIWKSLDNFRGEAALSTWIYRIAVNTSLSYMGKSYKKMKLNVGTDTLNLNSLIQDSGYEEKLMEEEQLNRLQIELNQLSVIDKALISLQLEGLSIKEIADIIGITEPNVKVKIHRIKETLRTQLKGGDHDKE